MLPEGTVVPGFLTDHIEELVVLVHNSHLRDVLPEDRQDTEDLVYLVDFACHKPPESQSCSRAITICRAWISGRFSERTLEFWQKMIERSGVGDSTYLPEGLVRVLMETSLEEALREARSVMFEVVEELLEKTGLEDSDIGILVVNCSLF